ncbi:hypothetical protein [Klenkia terrae]|uniref:Uncharacterized protein n=1 Tax=Klenkia terrae TaxID=1052259 RepID=A0ABU8E910_9ACTN|nr:hypothetical protein [Klenkia terrae]
MRWFGDVPKVLKVGFAEFMGAREALDYWQVRLDDEFASEQHGERPDPDRTAETLFLLAQVQLDQAVAILNSEFDVDARPFSGGEVGRRLRDVISAVEDGQSAIEAYQFEIDVVGEGVDLWRSLRQAESLAVTHAFEWDGSITLTLGPPLPQLKYLRVEGSDGAELNSTPMEVFSAASACTSCVAELAVRYRKWRSQGWGPEPQHEDGYGQTAP